MAQVPPPNYTHYPRPNFQGGVPGSPYSRPPGVYFDVFGDAWKMVTADLGTWILATILCAVVGIVMGGITMVLQVVILYGGDLMAMTQGESSFAAMIRAQVVSILLGLLPSTISYMVFFGLSNLAVRKAQGHAITAMDIFLPFQRFGPVFATVFLCIVLLYLGALFLIIPFFYLAGALSLAALISINQPVGPVDAIKMSIKTLGVQAWMMLLVGIVGYIFLCLGALACLVGMLFTTPVFAAIYGLHYHYFFPPASGPYVPMADVSSSY